MQDPKDRLLTPKEIEALTPEDLTTEYTNVASFIGDLTIRIHLLQFKLEAFSKQALLLVSRNDELSAQKKVAS